MVLKRYLKKEIEKSNTVKPRLLFGYMIGMVFCCNPAMKYKKFTKTNLSAP